MTTLTIEHREFELLGSQRLFAQSWTPSSDIRGVVGIVHGLGDHSNRYDVLAAQLAQCGLQVVAYDQIGHGRSGGRRGDGLSYDTFLNDIETLVAEITTDDPALPVFLYGQSFGGNLVLNFALRRHPKLTGVIASSPLLLPTHSPSQWKQFAGRFLQYAWPSFQFRLGIKAEGLSHDQDAIEAYLADPLIHGVVSARIGVAMLDAGEWALQRASETTIPMLLMHGSADPVTSAAATQEFASLAGPLCSWRQFPGLLHELHWESQRAKVFDVVQEWLEQRLLDHCSALM